MNNIKCTGVGMNQKMIIQPGDKLEVVVRRNEYGENDGSIIINRLPGQAYCIAKAPRYASTEEWFYNAMLIVKAIMSYNVKETMSRKETEQ